MESSRQAEEAEMAELREKSAKAGAELETISRPQALSSGAPRDTPSEELLERKTLLRHIVRSYDEQLDDLRRREQTRKRRVDNSGRDSQDLGQPPYSILLADQLWDTAFSIRLSVEGLQSQLSLIELRFDRARASLPTAEERVRQATERAEAAKGSLEEGRKNWLRDLEDLRRRAAVVTLQAAELSKARVEDELADQNARLEDAEQRLKSVESQVQFTEADLTKIQRRLGQERQDLAAELERATTEGRRHSDELQKMEQQLAARLAERGARQASNGSPERLRLAQATAEVQRVQTDNLALKADLLHLLLDVVEGEGQLWESRFTILHDTEREKAREAYRRFTPLFGSFSASRDYFRQQAGIVSGQIGELETRLRNSSPRDRMHVRTLLQTYRERAQNYDRALQRMDQASRFLERWKSEFKERQQELPLSARIQDWFQRTWETTKRAWNFEVFSAEDTIEVEGKKITGHRSVTVGKILTALTILLIGYWICLYLAGFIGRLTATRLGLTPDQGNLVRQWSQALLLTILIVVSLVSVKIPLTIFAFLGGAFAIGVGFGAQNLLKNVISGVLLLVERPLRVGDLIEVDNVRGRVTAIGLRSSTVRDAKGMETLIPNSSFLERHLTNWTYSSRISRFSLRVGAPYGSSTQQVMELLAGIASGHPQVLKVPHPQVLLEEFGSQARIFTLNYWLEIRLDVDPNEVASDLRFAIEQRFTQAGLKIFPAA